MLNTKIVSIDEFRSNLADLVNRVAYAKERIVVRKYNRDTAVLISVDEYEKLLDPTKRLSKDEWNKHAKRLDRIRNKIPAYDPDELDRIIGEEIEAYRAEKRVKSE